MFRPTRRLKRIFQAHFVVVLDTFPAGIPLCQAFLPCGIRFRNILPFSEPGLKMHETGEKARITWHDVTRLLLCIATLLYIYATRK